MSDVNITTAKEITYGPICMPQCRNLTQMPEIPASVYEKRIRMMTEALKENRLDAAVIYSDREHFQNFEYFFGFDLWFEEGLGIIKKDGSCFAILGNECAPLASNAKIPVHAVICPVFSLPNQPKEGKMNLEDAYKSCKIEEGQRIGCVGWKLFDTSDLFDMPDFVLRKLKEITGSSGEVVNITNRLIGPGSGMRNHVEAEQAAAFEFVTSMVSGGMLQAMEKIGEGVSELEIGACFNPKGLPLSCHSNVSSGVRTRTGLVSPSTKLIEKGDAVTMCWGMRGGLSCRAGYAAESEHDLPKEQQDYCEKLVKPYYAAAVSWYETIGIGITGGQIYQMIEEIFPKDIFGWELNPGHGLASEEWLNSPVYKGSDIPFTSGQMVQLDMIPAAQNGYATSNIEDGILLADEKLREEIQKKYPDMWERIAWRRNFMEKELGICLRPEVLPLYDTQGILNPFLLNKGYSMKKAK